MLQEWNAAQQEGGHQLAMNHWGDVSAAEYRSLLAGNKRPRREWAARAPATAVHQPTVPAHMIPNAVDWRGTAADSPVKNQAACGSCWVSGHTMGLQRDFRSVAAALCFTWNGVGLDQRNSET